ncbi:MAG: ribosome biogenesis GTPase Der [Bdellovibrionota bacterium]
MAKQSNVRVCLCGRPNVGKSSLFNRLIGKKKALVLDEPGVTRDVYRAKVEWNGHEIELADLAGLELWDDKSSSGTRRDSDTKTLRKLAAEAALEYLKESDLVLFVVDARAELTPADEALARLVRGQGRQVLVVLSKVEGNVGEQAQLEVARLGWAEAMPTSAEHNRGIEDLKEQVLAALGLSQAKEEAEEPTEEFLEEESVEKAPPEIERGLVSSRPIRLGVYGRPNVGKSTLVNMLLGEKRMITSPIAGTTVDTVDSDFVHENKFYRILDTAGIRRKSKTEQGVEVLSVVRALKSISDVDLALFLIDGYEGVTDQDEKIAGEILKTGKPVVLLVNKWDTCRVKKEDYAQRLRDTLGFLDFAPIVFISAERGEGIEPLWGLIEEILTQRHIVASTGELNRFLELVEGTNNPTDVRLYYASQTSKNPPTITLLVSDQKKVHFAYERFLKNELRQRYGWMGSPLRLIFKTRKRSASKKDRRT